MSTHSAESLAKTVFDYPVAKSSVEAVATLQKVAPAAEELALRAFRDQDKTAWKLVQQGIFGLPIFKVTSGKTADRFRPFLRGDLVAAGIRDIVWEVEEKHLTWVKPPRPGMTGEEVAALAEEDFRKRSVYHHPMFEYLATAKLTEAQQRTAVLAYLNSVMVRIRTVHRTIMLVSLPLEFEDCIAISPLVVDELGGGELEKAHAQRTARDIERWGGKVDWHAPVESVEMMAMLNWNLRTVTHPHSLWSFVGIFCVEWNSYLELRAALLAFRKRGIPDNMMDVLVVHGDGHPYDQDGHARRVREQLGKRITSDEDASLVLTAIARHQSLYHGFFEGEFAKLRAQVEGAGA
jgi:Iron-containing redox enzyme